jgi:molecular chaperone DnaK
MQTTHAVGIDLGTTYSSIAYLNEHGEPVTLANAAGELATPSVVLFDEGEIVVGTEALRNAIVKPSHVVQNSKRFIGHPNHTWQIDGHSYTPTDIAALILEALLEAAGDQIGRIDRAVITVPAQFSDAQRHATVEAGHRAGLKQVDIINEPVAAALVYVLGTEGLWFTELAEEQRILVYDLGGGTFDLSLVRYQKNEVRVLASSGDMRLGGIDWNQALIDKISGQFLREFGVDPRNFPTSLQALALEVEQTKRSLTTRSRAALTCQHDGHRKSYQIGLAPFEKLTKPFVDHTADIVHHLLKEKQMGWAHVDVVLTTGGASRMPMIRNKLRELSGRTLNTSLSPDLSIAHGATFYAGMLLSNSKLARSILSPKAGARLSAMRQHSVNARALGVMIRDEATSKRIPHYLIPANTPLPASVTQVYGTVIPNQKQAKLQIVESGTSPQATPVLLGTCIVDNLPANLPEASELHVTFQYDASARVHISARDAVGGRETSMDLIREENVVLQPATEEIDAADVVLLAPMPPETTKSPQSGSQTPAGKPNPSSKSKAKVATPVAGRAAQPTGSTKAGKKNAAEKAEFPHGEVLGNADVEFPVIETGESKNPRSRKKKSIRPKRQKTENEEFWQTLDEN